MVAYPRRPEDMITFVNGLGRYLMAHLGVTIFSEYHPCIFISYEAASNDRAGPYPSLSDRMTVQLFIPQIYLYVIIIICRSS